MRSIRFSQASIKKSSERFGTMTTTEPFDAVLQLPVATRRDLMLKIRESIQDHVTPDGLWYEDSPEFAVELERRLQDSKDHPEKLIPWEIVRERLWNKLRECRPSRKRVRRNRRTR